MHTLRKTVSYALICIMLGSPSLSFAATNKDSVVSSINSLNTNITTAISEKEKNLSDRANELGSRYDKAITDLGYGTEEVEALTNIKSLGVPSFRAEITLGYADAKDRMLKDIKATQTALVGLRDEVALGYTDLSSAQKQSYDAKIANLQNAYAAFLTGSTATINDFTTSFSGTIAPRAALVSKMMKENGTYIYFMRDIRSWYARIEEKKASILKQKALFENDILPRIQGGFVAFTANKKTFTNAIRTDLGNGLEKALVQERLKKQETELKAYLEDIMSKWNEYLRKNFGQDDELVDATKDVENALALEKALHNRVYDSMGNLQSLDIRGSGALLADMSKLDSNLWSMNSVLAGLIATYSTGNTLPTLNDKLLAGYKSEYAGYRAEFTKLLETKLNTSLLEEKNHAQTLALIDQEEKILKQNLDTTASLDFSKQLVTDFITKIHALSKNDNLSDTAKKVQLLSARYKRVLIQKRIDDTLLIPYYTKRDALDKALGDIFIKLENRSDKATLLTKFPVISEKIDTLLGTNISAKNRYTLLVVQYNILKYIEDASK